MSKFFALIAAAAFVVGLSVAPTLTSAEEDAVEEAEEATTAPDTSTEEPASDAPEDPVEEAEEGE